MLYYIVDKKIDKNILNNLSKYGNIILTGEAPDLYEPVNTHPDIQIHFLNNSLAVCCPELYNYYRQKLPNIIELKSGKSKVGGGYPNDAAYNAALVGKNLVCNTKYIDKIIIDYYKKIGYNIINVNQGYTKCNICPVSNNAVITEDAGIASELRKYKIDVCQINHGEVSLKNFPYGFIGGATGNIPDNKIGFFGDIKRHSNYAQIKDFISKYNKEIVCLSDCIISDFGSIIAFQV